MKKAILLSLLALLACVLIACQTGKGEIPDSSKDASESTIESSEPDRTRVPVSHSTLPPLPETTESPEPDVEPDPTLFLPETFDESSNGSLVVITDQPGYGAIAP